MTNPGAKYDAAANNQRLFEENKRLLALIGRQSTTIARLRGLLTDLEWSGPEERGEGERCPSCGAPGFIYPQVHDAGCRLAAELVRNGETAPEEMYCGDPAGIGPHEPHLGSFGELRVWCPGNDETARQP